MIQPSELYTRHMLSFKQIDLHCNTDFSDNYIKESIKCMKMLKKFLIISDLFFQNNIEFVPLKGLILSHRIYKDETYKRSTDVDFLINFEDFELAKNILFAEGYVINKPEQNVDKGNKFFFYHFNHIQFYNPVTAIVVEIHWRLKIYDFFGQADTLNFLKPFLTDYVFHNRTFKVLQNEYELLYLIVHGAYHKWYQLKWLYDSNDFANNVSLDFNKFYELVNKYKFGRIIALHNIVSAKFIHSAFQFSINEKMPKFLISYCVKEISTRHPKNESLKEVFVRSVKRYRYEYLLVPNCNRRKQLTIKFIKRDLGFYRIKKLVLTTLVKKEKYGSDT